MQTTQTQDKLLDDSQATGAVVKIVLAAPADVAFDAIVVRNAEDLCAVKLVRDFEEDGFSVIPRRQIQEVRRGQYEQCTDAVMKFVAGARAAPPPTWVAQAETLEDVFSTFQSEDIWPSVEVIYAKRTVVYIGKVVAVSSSAVTLQGYDAAGDWENPAELELDEIAKIDVDSRYLRNFNAYVRSKERP
jgi:hypothetical protein